MDNCLRQTYLWLALQEAISENNITPLKLRLQQIFLNILQPKVVALIQTLRKKSPPQKSRSKNLLTAKQVMYNQFEVGPQQVPKYRCVLYHISCPEQFKKHINVSSNHVAMVELYADDFSCKKKLKGQAVPLLINTEKQLITANKKCELKRPLIVSSQKKCHKRKKLE